MCGDTHADKWNIMVMMAYKRNPDQRNIRLKVVELVPTEQWVEGVSNCGMV